MRTRSRGLVATLAIAALILGHATSAAAFTRDDGDQNNSVPMVIDILLLRPTGLVLTVMGALVYAIPVAPIMAVTRPTDIAKPIPTLIGRPARFTFSDPIGQHP